MARYELSEVEWRIVEPLLPVEGKGAARVDQRRVVNGIFYVLRTGSPWRDLRECYGPYTMAYNRFNRWRARASGWRSSKPWRRARRSRCSSSTARSCAPTNTRRAQKSGSASRPWPFSWRS
jgi:transposase